MSVKKVFQITDDTGAPQGGRVFVAPDEASLDASIAGDTLPAGWTRTEVADESAIVSPPPPPMDPGMV